MRKFNTFFFESFSFDPDTLIASFEYSFDGEVKFTEQIGFASTKFTPKADIDPEIMNNLLFHLSLAIGISYYKLYPTESLVVKSWYLNEDQITFWQTFYLNGLGEFFFRNKLSPKAFAHFVNSEAGAEKFSFLSTQFLCPLRQAMVALGGGKDSLVSVELIKKAGIPFYTSTFGKNYRLHHNVSQKIGVNRLVMQRNIDPLLFKMNDEGYYNGHVPISGIIAFVLTTAAYLYDYDYIVMSNEKSADEGNTILDGMVINHQWSKSLVFEQAFADYLKQYISPDVKYFSLLRSMYEIKIAEIFSHYHEYFDVFSSCNTNFKVTEDTETTLWSPQYNNQRRCGKCPKCAFVYTILRPFISKDDVKLIFWHELFADEGLKTTFEELLGISWFKPFECVGTNEEMVLAMKKSFDLWQDSYDEDLPPLLQLFADRVLPSLHDWEFVELERKLMSIGNEDLVPLDLRSVLFSA